MQELRCGACRKKLGAGIFIEIQIKCPRCKTMNYLRAERSTSARHERQEQRTTRGKIHSQQPELIQS
jgi:phage FluMu protein Com